MLDNYIKKLENIIVPRQYSINDVKQINTNFNANQIKQQKPIMTTFSNSTAESFMKTAAGTNNIKEVNSKVEQSSLQPIKEESSQITATIADEEKLSLIEIINQEKKKNMNYRFQIAELQRKNDYLTVKLEKQNEMLIKMEKQKDLDTKYLIKLEAMLSGTSRPNNTTVNNINNNSQFVNTTKIFNQSKIDTDGNFRTNFNKLLLEDNQKLKKFKEEVFKISKTYDDVNDELIYYLKEIQSLLNLTNEEDFKNEKVVADSINTIKSNLF
jgi:hypothetical protein